MVHREHFLFFFVEGIECAIPLAATQAVVRMVQFIPGWDCHGGEVGAIDVHGSPVPVYSLRARFGSAERPPRLTDALIVVRHGRGRAALWVDETSGVRGNVGLGNGQEQIAVPGAAVTEGGTVIISDIGAFLAEADAETLRAAVRRSSGAAEGGR
ncbi:chemotaxis protein CheW [Methanoculleus frigidifontis]|uniref:chemotaxis protein CheW n=1 Tax=Methanoculleus frigidifontis TaxID=2584085 RepID=UPI00265ABAD6|nr:chemotaxis protein CheW [Methanoculleus sp. FWC-SCC1]